MPRPLAAGIKIFKVLLLYFFTDWIMEKVFNREEAFW